MPPSETSPLLQSNGPASTGAIPTRDAHADTESGGQPIASEELAKEPFPDAQKQLKYIIPAISIGV
jgi:hypothetical protein